MEGLKLPVGRRSTVSIGGVIFVDNWAHHAIQQLVHSYNATHAVLKCKKTNDHWTRQDWPIYNKSRYIQLLSVTSHVISENKKNFSMLTQLIDELISWYNRYRSTNAHSYTCQWGSNTLFCHKVVLMESPVGAYKQLSIILTRTTVPHCCFTEWIEGVFLTNQIIGRVHTLG